MNIFETATANPELTTLVAAVTAAKLVDTLSAVGPYTLFAPTNEAFAKLPAEDLSALLADHDKLVAVLTYHVMSGKEMAKDLATLTDATTVEGSKIKVESEHGTMINGASVVTGDIECTNGVIHIIDAVLMPE